MADEVLYQAKLYPELKAHSLTDAQIQQLHEALWQVPEAAVAAEADSEKFPPGWLFHVRWDGKKMSPKIDGNMVEFLKVGGRVRHAYRFVKLAKQCWDHASDCTVRSVDLCFCAIGSCCKAAS